ncbi:hypothetical protein GF406_14190 [candidate division KSB1 bacterium]|nr:hypothetical protein [candidate division KSB1 bacterium]
MLSLKHKYLPGANQTGWSLRMLLWGPIPFGMLLFSYIVVQTAHPGLHPVGYKGLKFDKQLSSSPTGEKPQSKLWFHDRSWWGLLWSQNMERFTIHRLNNDYQTWKDTGVAADPRTDSKCDVLWDGRYLYVASHCYFKRGKLADKQSGARLYRYRYHSTEKYYQLDPGFPAVINTHASESLVLDKDSTGQLWITWPFQGHIMMNRSLDDDRSWGEPFNLPAQKNELDPETISSLIAFDGNIGVMWSDQLSNTVYFSVHPDSAHDRLWQEREVALHIPGKEMADDHIHLKTHQGMVWAVTKTSLTDPKDPLIVLLKRMPQGLWQHYTVGKVEDRQTRPILLIDKDNECLYVITSAIQNHISGVFVNKSFIHDIHFQSGPGQSLIMDYDAKIINNPSSSKHNIDWNTGLLILASDMQTCTYLHNYVTGEILAQD